MVILMAVGIHYPAPMPEWRSPAAPVLMSIVRIEDKPAAFHFRVAQFSAAPARHFAFVEGEVHMFRGVSVEIVHAKCAVALGKTPRGKRI